MAAFVLHATPVKEEGVIERHNGLAPRVMVGGAISYHGRSNLLRIEGLGILGMYRVILSHGQVTRITPERALCCHTMPARGRLNLDRFNEYRVPLHGGSSIAQGLKTGRTSHVPVTLTTSLPLP
ncbi:hypothetical protein TNCV_2864561 [Trichonephila clavipes]|nr:hypothetical protein TNCV_2864561 [Trichonephila clavipes]